MPDPVQRTEQLALLKSLSSISPQGARGLAMLAKGVELARVASEGDDESSVAGSLISYCIRDAIDSIFPKLSDPKIRDAAERLVSRWRRVSARPGTDLASALQDDFKTLEYAVAAATAGFLPRVSSFLEVLHPRLPADLGIPAMTKLRDLNKAANGGLHGSTTHAEAVELLDQVLERLVDLVGPLAVTVQQYQALVDAGDFQGVSNLLRVNSDPRIRVYLFDRVRDPLLAEALDVVELLPGPELWLAYGYVRHLAEEDAARFSAFVDRVASARRLSAEAAAQLLICATFAGADAVVEVDRLSESAGGKMRVELVARWLRSEVDAAPASAWWKILTRVISCLDESSGRFRARTGVNELLDLAMARLPDATATARSRFASAVLAAVARIDVESPYLVLFHFDNRHLRGRTSSDLVVDAAVHVVAIAESRAENIDLASLSELSREALARAAVASAIAMATPDRALAIAGRALDAILARMSGDEWPDAMDLDTLQLVLPMADSTAGARIAAVLGEPPPIDVLVADLETASELRADWFRTAQWVAHLPEQARPASWAAALRESADRGTTFGPLPPADRLVLPSTHESPFGDVDTSGATVPEFVALLDDAVGVGEPHDPRFAMNAQESIITHTSTHREAWASDDGAIMQVRDLWARLAIVRVLRSESNDEPRLRWTQLQRIWSGLVAEANTLVVTGSDAAKAPLSRLAGEILAQLCHRVAEQPRRAGDVDWWAKEVLPSTIPILAWLNEEARDRETLALSSLDGEAVRLLVALSSPIDDDSARDASLGQALDLLATAAVADSGFARSIGHWARWLILRDPAWWERHSGHLIGLGSTTEIHDSLLTANWQSGDFALGLLDRDVTLLNRFSSQPTEGAAAPALTAVLFGVLPIAGIEEQTWSAIFRDGSSAERALAFLFPDHSVETDEQAARRLEILRWAATDAHRARVIWESVDVIAGSPDVGDDALFAFAAELAGSNRGAPTSTFHLAERFVRSLTNPTAVETLEAMCAANLGRDRAVAQYDMEPVNAWFQGEGRHLPADLRVRVQRALFELGFVNDTEG